MEGFGNERLFFPPQLLVVGQELPRTNLRRSVHFKFRLGKTLFSCSKKPCQ